MKTFLIGKLFFPIIRRNYFCLENLEKVGKVYFFSEGIRNFSLRTRKIGFLG